MKQKNKFHVLIVMIIALGFLLAGCQPNGENKEEDTIKVGVIAPMSGKAASYGEYVLNSLKIGINEFNNQSEAFNFKAIYEDGKCDPKESVTAIKKLMNVNDVDYIIGGFCSGETLGAAPIAEKNEIILLSPGSGSPDISDAGDYIFRNFVSDDFTAKSLANIALEQGDKNMGLITENTDYPQTLKEAFIDSYASKGGNITLDETFTDKSLDFRTIITKAKNENIKNILVIVQSYKHADRLLKQMEELDYSPKIYTTESVVSSEALGSYGEGYKDKLNGAIFSHPKFNESRPKAKKLLEKYKVKHGSTEGPIPPLYLATYYDAPFLLGEAINNAGNDPAKVKEYLYTIKGWNGAVGNFSFDEKGDAVLDVEVKTIQNGSITTIS
ncbi:MAG: ABC transporter substrate-binding protein [Candidatus Aenigmatarchaeota archaeon]